MNNPPKDYCIALTLLVLFISGCVKQEDGECQAEEKPQALCKIAGTRIFDIKQSDAEKKAGIIREYSIISEVIIINFDGSYQWDFRYEVPDVPKIHKFQGILPDNIMESLRKSMRRRFHIPIISPSEYSFEVKNGTPTLEYDLTNSSMFYPTSIEKLWEFLFEQHIVPTENYVR